MKIKPKIYAEALVGLMIEKKPKDVVGRFLKLLEKNGDISKAKKIIEKTESILLKKKGHKKVLLETAREIDNRNLMKLFFKEGDAVDYKINKDLIAGIKVTINGESQLDFSLQRKLEKLFSS